MPVRGRVAGVEAGRGHRGGSGEPLVLIHGFTSAWPIWEPILGRLEASYAVLAGALTGHVGGRPVPEGRSVSMDLLIDGVEEDMDEAGFQTAHLVGNSLGGWIALELARRGRGRSVVALSPAGGWGADTREEARARQLFIRGHAISKRLVPYADRLMARPRLRRALLSQMMVHGERLSPARAAQSMRDAFATPIYFDLMDAILRDGPPETLDGISCPVLLAWGTKDRVLPLGCYSQRLRELLPAAGWVELPGLGHVPMADDPELVTRTITEFAARAPQPAAAPA